MDLPNLLNKLKSTPEEPKKFIAIEVGLDAVKTALWQSTGLHTEVISTGSVQAWSTSNIDDLITAIDTSLADAQASETEEPDQVIFGLPETWVEGDGIAEPKKIILKTICKKLGLKAIGFVVSSEAMVHHLRDVEGGPPSAIMIQIASTEIAVSLVYLGKLEATRVVGRSTTIAADVEEGLARIPHSGHLPSRIILVTNVDDPEPIKQELISYDWQKKLEFLHFPKIESLPRDWSIKAVAIAGGSEVIETVGFANMAASTVAKPPAEPTAPDEDLKLSEPHEASAPDTEPPKPETKERDEPALKPQTSAAEFGFTSNTAAFEAAEPVENEPVEEPLPPKSDVTNIEEVEADALAPPDVKPPLPQKLLLGFGRRMKRLVQFKTASPSVSVTLPGNKRRLIPLLILAVVGVGCAALGFAYYRLPQAAIDIYVGLNPYEQQMVFTIDPAAVSGNLESLIIPGKKEVLEKTGTKTQATTGTKTVGDRAKGKVNILNRTTAAKTFPAGTVLKSGNLRFTLDSSVTVASASAKESANYSITIEPSTTETNVTAADIGEQYNLAKDAKFSVANFADENFLAVASTSLTGGSARKVAAVSKEDQDSLKQALVQELRTEIDQSMQDSSQESLRQISIGEPQITKEEYSGKKGDEADNVSLDLSMTQTVYRYDLAEVSLMAQQIAASALPANIQLKPDSTKINILNTAVGENDKAVVTAQVVLQYIPRIDSEQYEQALVNAPLKDLAAKLQTVPNYREHSIDPKFLFLGRLPLVAEQIKVFIKPVNQGN